MLAPDYGGAQAISRPTGDESWLFSARAATLPLPYGRSVGRIRGLVFGAFTTVANIKSAEKRARQTVKRRARNVAGRSKLRTAIKGVVNAVEAGDKETAIAKLKAAGPIIDSAVNKGLIHRNKASRHKSALNARVKELSAG
jgi:small subunit ribosomal protein S20